MRTLVISDLHLGAASGSDVLRRPDVRAPLLAEAERADRIVLLGDVVELRDRPQREALDVAGPLLEALGRALGPARHVHLVGRAEVQVADHDRPHAPRG